MHRTRPIILLIALLLLAAMACNFVTGGDEPTAVPEVAIQADTDTPEPLPTEPPPTEAPPTEAPPAEPPATEPAPTEAPSSGEPAAALALDSTPYAHYLGFFEVYPPAGWSMN